MPKICLQKLIGISPNQNKIPLKKINKMLLTILLTSLAVIVLVSILNFASYKNDDKVVATHKKTSNFS